RRSTQRPRRRSMPPRSARWPIGVRSPAESWTAPSPSTTRSARRPRRPRRSFRRWPARPTSCSCPISRRATWGPSSCSPWPAPTAPGPRWARAGHSCGPAGPTEFAPGARPRRAWPTRGARNPSGCAEDGMPEAIAVINAGSSSLKFSLFFVRGDDLTLDVRGQVEGLSTAPRFVAKDASGRTVAERSWREGMKLSHDDAVEHLRGFLREQLAGDRLIGGGHRVVHGGLEYSPPVRVDSTVIKALEQFVALAPLHQPHNLSPIAALLKRAPDLPQVACFDTAFHRTNPEVAQRFALPQPLHDAGVRRYGFHGLSYEYVASVLAGFDASAAAGKTIVLHLGNGSSMCALAAGRSVASTMGFTAVDGLPMGTRSGALDPGVILYLMDERKMSVRAVERLIYNESGLLGVSGISS